MKAFFGGVLIFLGVVGCVGTLLVSMRIMELMCAFGPCPPSLMHVIFDRDFFPFFMIAAALGGGLIWAGGRLGRRDHKSD